MVAAIIQVTAQHLRAGTLLELLNTEHYCLAVHTLVRHADSGFPHLLQGRQIIPYACARNGF